MSIKCKTIYQRNVLDLGKNHSINRCKILIKGSIFFLHKLRTPDNISSFNGSNHPKICFACNQNIWLFLRAQVFKST